MTHASNTSNVYEGINRIRLSDSERDIARSQMRTAEAITDVMLGITTVFGQWVRPSKRDLNQRGAGNG